MNNSIFDIAMYRFCAVITGNLLGAGHPLAQPRERPERHRLDVIGQRHWATTVSANRSIGPR